ncbi:DUF6318 family protein [Nocardioides abyssi]|uniref:DUF6318 family protein n=1 Tax=Nocardioides abyssi TaxID=3058370 RepID=A0ABT8EXK1_9ACTN|nr:DUF6318 family protein [Nocardioides abyssi]MDN4162875.1 DUF6318 family protein [Nocardioides abyssi]
MPLRNLGALALVATLALSACSSDDPKPKVAPETSAPSSSGSAPPSGDPVSEGSDPSAAVEAWIAAQNEALATGDTTSVRVLSTPDCHSCDGLIDPIERVHEAGGYFETDGWRIDKSKVTRQGQSAAVIDTAVTITGGKTVNARGEKPVTYDEDKRIIKFKVRRDGEQWAVAFIGFL